MCPAWVGIILFKLVISKYLNFHCFRSILVTQWNFSVIVFNSSLNSMGRTIKQSKKRSCNKQSKKEGKIAKARLQRHLFSNNEPKSSIPDKNGSEV